MKIRHGETDNGGEGPGVVIELTGYELKHAIDSYLKIRGVTVMASEPCQVTVNSGPIWDCKVFVDPGGSVENEDGVKLYGRGPIER